MRWGRAIATTLLVAALAAALALRVMPAPFVAVASGSMSPTLERGDLVLVGSPPESLDVGDVVVVQVPLSIQQRYNYPPAIVHRIVKVDTATDGTESYRTKGDNGPEDAFTTYPVDVQGVVGHQVRYAGYPILFLYSTQGLIFLAGTLAIYAAYVASGRLGAWTRRGLGRFATAVGASAAAETRRVGEESQARMGQVETALNSFSDAMREYATHLRSHTAAVQQMAQAAQEIRGSVEVQQQALVAALGRAPDVQSAGDALLTSPAPVPVADTPPAAPHMALPTPADGPDREAFIRTALDVLGRDDGARPEAAEGQAGLRVFRYKSPSVPKVAATPSVDAGETAYRILEWGA